jgi:hypothetical protein
MRDAFGNLLATFVRKPEFGVLVAVDQSFGKIAENLTNPPDFLAAFMLIRSHAAFRGACRMAASGQVPETFPLLRSCIEYALYALHINAKPALGEVWMRRHDDEDTLKTCRTSFKHASVIGTLKRRDAKLHKTIALLYERTIDFGGHPNERAMTGNVRLTESKDESTFSTAYLHGDALSLSLEHAIKTTAQIGLGSLITFEHIFKDRFRLLGIDIELQMLRSVL